MTDLKADIRELAHGEGFDLFGVAPPAIPPARRDAYLDWLGKGYHAGMGYLARNVEKRLDPAALFRPVRSILCFGASYYQPDPAPVTPPGWGRVARYAWGGDYHVVLKVRLRRLAAALADRLGRRFEYRMFVDSAPVLEKPLAESAGLGWIGQNGCLIHQRMGSFFVLGELFTDLDLEPDEPAQNHCGRCRRCLEACPTGALVAPGVVRADRCVSYLTIEHRGEVPAELAAKMPPWIFGCDACQEVCPFNRFARASAVEEFREHRLGPAVDPTEAASWDESAARTRLAGGPGGRADLDMWRRNARIVLGEATRPANPEAR